LSSTERSLAAGTGIPRNALQRPPRDRRRRIHGRAPCRRRNCASAQSRVNPYLRSTQTASISFPPRILGSVVSPILGPDVPRANALLSTSTSRCTPSMRSVASPPRATSAIPRWSMSQIVKIITPCCSVRRTCTQGSALVGVPRTRCWRHRHSRGVPADAPTRTPTSPEYSDSWVGAICHSVNDAAITACRNVNAQSRASTEGSACAAADQRIVAAASRTASTMFW